MKIEECSDLHERALLLISGKDDDVAEIKNTLHFTSNSGKPCKLYKYQVFVKSTDIQDEVFYKEIFNQLKICPFQSLQSYKKLTYDYLGIDIKNKHDCLKKAKEDAVVLLIIPLFVIIYFFTLCSLLFVSWKVYLTFFVISMSLVLKYFSFVKHHQFSSFKEQWQFAFTQMLAYETTFKEDILWYNSWSNKEELYESLTVGHQLTNQCQTYRSLPEMVSQVKDIFETKNSPMYWTDYVINEIKLRSIQNSKERFVITNWSSNKETRAIKMLTSQLDLDIVSMKIHDQLSSHLKADIVLVSEEFFDPLYSLVGYLVVTVSLI